jgi:hypothetical protein
MALAGSGSFILGLPLEGALLFFLFHFAHVLESKFVDGAERSLSGLLDAIPQKARRVSALPDGGVDWSSQELVCVDSVPLGTLLVVKPGEVVPLDGIVSEGSALVGEIPDRARWLDVHDVIMCPSQLLYSLLACRARERDRREHASAETQRLSCCIR